MSKDGDESHPFESGLMIGRTHAGKGSYFPIPPSIPDCRAAAFGRISVFVPSPYLSARGQESAQYERCPRCGLHSKTLSRRSISPEKREASWSAARNAGISRIVPFAVLCRFAALDAQYLLDNSNQLD
jgi:hypothetical protein